MNSANLKPISLLSDQEVQDRSAQHYAAARDALALYINSLQHEARPWASQIEAAHIAYGAIVHNVKFTRVA